MDALLYQDGAYTTFYANKIRWIMRFHLHVAIPFGILVLNYLHVKRKGKR